MKRQVPDVADVLAAAERLRGHAVTTPLIESPVLGSRVRGRVFLKLETLQIGGSFKFRGAFNRLAQLTPAQSKAGVVAWSSGNHAQAVALAAKKLGLRAIVVMPADAPRIKIDNTLSYGAEIKFYDRYKERREEIAATIAETHGAALAPPYDHGEIIAGQGTVGLEIARQASEVGVTLDAVYIPCGGGGLIAGAALAIAKLSAATKVFCVEPVGFDDTIRSLASGRRVANDPAARTICDALMVPTPGELTFEINRRYVAGGVTVSDDEVKAAVRCAARDLKLVVEPGGAVALAALLAGKIEAQGKNVALVLSGGNIDMTLLQDVLRGA